MGPSVKKALLSRVFIVIASLIAGYLGVDLGQSPVIRHARCEVTGVSPVVTDCHTQEEPDRRTPFERAES